MTDDQGQPWHETQIFLLAATIASAALALAGCVDSGQDGELVPETVADDPSLPSFTLEDGRQVHLQTFGDPANPALIVLHGGPGGDHRDALSLTELSDEHFVIFWDQRGTGLSERVPNEELDGPTYLADLDYLGERFSPSRPFRLIGHSWGGAYATYYVQNFPERVDKLVLAEPGALGPEAARRVNVASVNFGAGGFQEFLHSTDYLLPDVDARADYFYVIALAGLKEGQSLLGYDFWRLGYRANIGINRWQGNFDGSYSFDFLSGLEAFDREVLFIAGSDEGRLGHDFQVTYHVPHFRRARMLRLPEAEHSELLRSRESIDAIRAYLREPS